MNFVPGADWSERGAGTNAPGTALALDAELQIRGSEHFSRIVQPWSCTAVPVHDPTTGALIGAIDLTGGTQVASPQTLALVRATAVAVENHLALLRLRQTRRRRTDRRRAADGPRRRPAALAGRPTTTATSGQHVDRPARRHPGAAQPPPRRPVSADHLAMLLDDKDLDVVTIRAEMSRLRRVIGAEFIASRPYRLLSPIASDMDDVSTRSKPATSTAALTRYTGALLPQSVSPGDCAAAHRAQRERARRGAGRRGTLGCFAVGSTARRPRRPGRLAGAVRQGRAGFGHACAGPRPSRRPGPRSGLSRRRRLQRRATVLQRSETYLQ